MKVQIGEAQYDALTTIENANRHLAGDVSRAAVWALRQSDAKARGIVSATRMMLGLPWCATPPDPAADVLPVIVQEVTAELASDLLARPRLFADASGNSNVKSAKAGSAQVEFFAPVRGGAPIPRALWDRLLSAGLVCLGTDAGTDLDGPYVGGQREQCRPLDGRYARGWPCAAEDYD